MESGDAPPLMVSGEKEPVPCPSLLSPIRAGRVRRERRLLALANRSRGDVRHAARWRTPPRRGTTILPCPPDHGARPMSFELGVYSFGNTPRTADGGYGATAQAIRDVLEAVHVAEEVGLDFFGFGEHHTQSMPLSSPTALLNAAAASTHRIGLGTTVTVLSTDDPIRVFEQLATAAAIAPGRIEAVAGRGSSPITFPLFDLDERDYDMLYSSKLDLLLKINGSDRVSWSGPHRHRPLTDALVVPRPEQPLRIWLGTGGSPGSVLRAAELGLPMFLGILGGTPEYWAR